MRLHIQAKIFNEIKTFAASQGIANAQGYAEMIFKPRLAESVAEYLYFGIDSSKQFDLSDFLEYVDLAKK